jgi:hypothetical protein
MKNNQDNLELILELLEQGKSREEILSTFNSDADILDILDEIQAIDVEVKPHPAILQKAIDSANASTHAVFKRRFFPAKLFAIAGSFVAVTALALYIGLVALPGSENMGTRENSLALLDDGDSMSDDLSKLDSLDAENSMGIPDDLLAFADSLELESSDLDATNDIEAYDEMDAQMQKDFEELEQDFAELAFMYDDSPDDFNEEFDELVS